MKMRPGESKYWIITEKANLGERIYLYIQMSKPEAPSSGKQHTSCRWETAVFLLKKEF